LRKPESGGIIGILGDPVDHEKFNSWGQTQEEDIARPIIGISPENAISV